MAEALPLAFVAGLLSIITPCVLPLVPGYLSAVSAVEADRLGEAGVGRRVARSSIPFILGFTTVFVVLGAGAAALGGVLDANRRAELAGFVLVVLGLAFLGLLPWPERLVAPGLLTGARRRGSGVLLGAAFAVCAAPCIGTVLASVLVLAGKRRGDPGGLGDPRRVLRRPGGRVRARGDRVRARDGRVPLAARPLRRDPHRQRRRCSSSSAWRSSSTATGGSASASTGRSTWSG